MTRIEDIIMKVIIILLIVGSMFWMIYNLFKDIAFCKIIGNDMIFSIIFVSVSLYCCAYTFYNILKPKIKK